MTIIDNRGKSDKLFLKNYSTVSNSILFKKKLPEPQDSQQIVENESPPGSEWSQPSSKNTRAVRQLLTSG